MAVSSITATVFHPLSKDITRALADIGITKLTLAHARSPVIEQTAFLGRKRIVDDPVDILSFLVPEAVEDQVVSHIIRAGRLNVPGRGSVCAKQVELPHAANARYINAVHAEGLPLVKTLRQVCGICCIVQRGQGDRIGRVALEMGACVPSVTFGTGLGLRDKMGLLRITIPAEKVMVWATVSAQDAEIVFNGMIETGQLDQPGKGFIYMFPLKQAHLNMDVMRGAHHAAASIEQIIVAIDGIVGGSDWRQRIALSDTQSKRNFLRGQVDFSLLCDEGSGDELVGVAMAAGAGGASIAKVQYSGDEIANGDGATGKTPAQEICYMIIGADIVPAVMAALEEAGCFSERHHGLVITSPTHKALTYLSRPQD